MNKTELVAFVAKQTDLTKAQSAEAVNAVLDGIATALINKDKVQLVGFGTFEVRERAAREGKNPRTGEAITIPASKTVGFKVGKTVKDALND